MSKRAKENRKRKQELRARREEWAAKWNLDTGEERAETRYVITRVDHELGIVEMTVVDENDLKPQMHVSPELFNTMAKLIDDPRRVWQGEMGATLHGVLK